MSGKNGHSNHNGSSPKQNGHVEKNTQQQIPKKRWQTWKGENNFYSDGKCVTGPDKMKFYIAFLLIIVPIGVFYGVIAPSIVRLLPGGGFLCIPFGLVLNLILLSSFFMTAFMDPGILDRQPPPPLPDDPFKAASMRPAPYKNVMIGSFQYQSKYCDTCNIYRPPRAVHCGICNNCVDRFDHHCPWVGNCIGKRNYRSFLIFVYSVMLNVFYMMSWSIIEFYFRARLTGKVGSDAFTETISNPVSFILAIYTLGIGGFVGILAGYHCKLVSVNLTTNEEIKKTYAQNNPHDLGFFRNWIFMCFPPYYPRHVPWEDFVVDEKKKRQNGVVEVV